MRVVIYVDIWIVYHLIRLSGILWIDVEYGRIMQILKCDEISKPLPEPVYPTYVVEQPDYETEPVCVVTVNKPNSPVDQSEELLKKLLAVLTPTVPPPARAQDESPRDRLVKLLLSEAVKREPAPPKPAEPPGLETLLRTYFAEQQSPRQGPRLRQLGSPSLRTL